MIEKREYSEPVTCATCGRIIFHKEKRAQCKKCLSFYQCIECYTVGSQPIPRKERGSIHEHTKNHEFVIFDKDMPSICRKGWRGDEEYLLVTGVSTLGFGNWNDIACFIGTKTARECEDYYRQVYLESPYFPLPKADTSSIVALQPPPDFDTQPVQSFPSEKSDLILKGKHKARPNSYGEFSGYMPFRHECEVTYHDEAELLLEGLEFNTYMSMDEFNHNLEFLQAYNEQVVIRQEQMKLAEQWDIPNVERLPKDLVDSLGFEAFHENAQAFISLAPYIDKTNLTNLITSIGRKKNYSSQIATRLKWQDLQIENSREGNLYNLLDNIISNAKSADGLQEKINEQISLFDRKYNNSTDSKDADKDGLSSNEKDVCFKANISCELYLAIKDFFIRQSVSGQPITRSFIRANFPNNAYMFVIYDYLTSVGLIPDSV